MAAARLARAGRGLCAPPRPRHKGGAPAGAGPRCLAARAAAAEAGPPAGLGGALQRTLSASGEVTVTAADCTAAVQDAVRRHGAAPTAAAAIGRAVAGTLLLAAFKGEDEQVQLTFKGNGPLGRIIAIGTHDGYVRASVGDASADPPLRPDGKLNVGAAVGKVGVLSVVRSHPALKEPYTGVVPLESGEIAEDIAAYLRDSEQVASAVGLGVSIGRSGEVLAAGGWMVQLLPFAGEDTISALESNIAALPSTTAMLEDGLTVDGITRKILAGGVLEPSPGDQLLVPRYGPCEPEDLRDRMRRAVASLGRGEIEDILREQDGKVEVRCDFCGDVAVFGREDLEAAL